ncbi:hypothetical protein LTR84_004722 [Exophiala bonariae]|uniref:Uncharacterized protein n=1 Tax=Exophiala bonariae TaxID=1690606 RepID=A0AAV9NMZ8_9EURO|nr:hypothetical protein LTR84_004722 [Exophiala bonariae]
MFSRRVTPKLKATAGTRSLVRSTIVPRCFQTTVAKLDLISQLSQRNRVTVITGGSRGIGLFLGEAIASLGGDIAILDIIEPQKSRDVLKSRYNVKVEYYKTDITSQSNIESSFDQVVAEFGRVDNCVTAAGIALDKPFIDTTWEESKKLLDINLLGTYFTAQAAARRMIDQKVPGSIVTVASIAAHSAIPGQRVSIYGASKAAVKLVSKTLAVELAPHGIRVNSISPGFISTDMSKQFAHLTDLFNRVPPVGRIGQREDLALAVAYLLSSSGAAYTTGADIPVTGGLIGGRIEV